MAFREVRVFEIREVLRLWLRGEGLRSIERLGSVDRKTARRYVAAAQECGRTPNKLGVMRDPQGVGASEAGGLSGRPGGSNFSGGGGVSFSLGVGVEAQATEPLNLQFPRSSRTTSTMPVISPASERRSTLARLAAFLSALSYATRVFEGSGGDFVLPCESDFGCFSAKRAATLSGVCLARAAFSSSFRPLDDSGSPSMMAA